MKKHFIILLVIAILISLIGTISVGAAGGLEGDGTDINPYKIRTKDDFLKIKENPSASYLLCNDLNLGSDYVPFKFSGKFIGDRTSDLRSVYISISNETSNVDNPLGLFSSISGAVQIKNIKLKGSIIGMNYVGGFAGNSNIDAGTGAIIQNCINEATIYGNDYVGGIIGYANRLNIDNCKNVGNIYGNTYVGGIASALIGNTAVTNCINEANINGDDGYAGGLVGYMQGDLHYCINNGNITGTTAVGGIVGFMYRTQNSSYVLNTGTIASNTKELINDCGGIFGALRTGLGSYAVIDSSYNIGDVISENKNYNPIHPEFEALSEDNYIKLSNCYYYSRDLRDDKKENTQAVNDTNDEKARAIISDIQNKTKAISDGNNAFWIEDILSKLNAEVALHTDLRTAVYKIDSRARLTRLDLNDARIVPFLKNGSVFVPVGFITEIFGGKVKWNPDKNCVELFLTDKTITFFINSNEVSINGIMKTINQVCFIENGRTFVPLRAISELMDKYVYWHESGLILIGNDEINPSEEYVKLAEKIWYILPSDIESRVKTALPGDEIIIADGVYENIEMNIDFIASEDKPLTIRAQTPGNVRFTGQSSMQVSGEYVHIKGFNFDNCIYNTVNAPSIFTFIKATGCRLTECRFYQCGNSTSATTSMILFSTYAKNNRVDNNLIEDSRAMSVVVSLNFTTTASSAATGNRIDHNYFRNIKAVWEVNPSWSNGYECVQTGQGDNVHTYLNTIVEYNRFENTICDGGEIISNKSSGNIFRYNTFVNSDSQLCIRGGLDNQFVNNFLINVSLGLRVYGKRNIIKDNYFYESGPLNFDSTNSNLDRMYEPTDDSVALENVFINPKGLYGGPPSAIVIGRQYDTKSNRNHLSSVYIRNNEFYLDNANAITDYPRCENVVYSDNEVTLKGCSEIGIECTDGFNLNNKSLYYDGEIYLPDGITIDKTGMIFLKNISTWWGKELYDDVDGAVITENNDRSVSYTPHKEEYFLHSGEKFNINSLIGNATYQNGSTERVKSGSVTFKTDSPSARLNGDILEVVYIDDPKGYNVFDVISEYKGLSAKTTIKVYPAASYNSSTGDYYDYNGVIPRSPVGGKTSLWTSENGKLMATNDTDVQSKILIANYSQNFENYEFSCDVTLNSVNDNVPKLRMLIGYTDYFAKKFYEADLFDNGTIRATDSTVKVGEVYGGIKIGKTQKLKVVKRDNLLSVVIDDEIISNIDVDNMVGGKFGFNIENGAVVVENINIKEKYAETAELKTIQLSAKRIGSNTSVIAFEGIGDGYVYRLYRNNVFWGLVKPNTNLLDDTGELGETHKYEIRGYDNNSVLCGSGEAVIELDTPEKNEFFMLSNVLSRHGDGGEFIQAYPYKNRFFKAGIENYGNRSYYTTKIDENLYDSAYIRTFYRDDQDALFRTEPDDWMKFDINRSATVYIFCNLVTDYVPQWLEGWELRKTDKFEGTGSTGWKTAFVKHFDTADGVNKTIELGGFKAGGIQLGYFVVVKPDKMQNAIKIDREF